MNYIIYCWDESALLLNSLVCPLSCCLSKNFFHTNLLQKKFLLLYNIYVWHFKWVSLASKGPFAIKPVLFRVISISELYVIVYYTTMWHIIVNIYDEVLLEVQRSIMFHCVAQQHGSWNRDRRWAISLL